jgi:hypothetical protein
MKVSVNRNITSISSKKLQVFNSRPRFGQIDFQAKLTRRWSPRVLYSTAFRSFFGLLKTKVFLNESRLSFLKFFKMNPRRGKLSYWVSRTKVSNPEAVNSVVTNVTRYDHHVSLPQLKWVVLKHRRKCIAPLRYLMFKHRIYNYTTPKPIASYWDSVVNYNKFGKVMSANIDPRISLMSGQTAATFNNTHTVSTYNWKQIV